MPDIGTTVPFSPLAGTAESRWLRLVQVAAEDAAATMDQAAELIDSLYEVSPCDTGTEGAGTGADTATLPDEDDFLDLAGKTLGEICAEPDHWDAQVDLLRSHADPSAWQLRSDTATHVRTDLVIETRVETVSLDGADHHDLEYPYHGGLVVRGAEVVDVRGSTVNFARPVHGRVRITYRARIERLTLRVPAAAGSTGQAAAEPAAAIVFWDGRAAQIDLRQPETDDVLDPAERERLCRVERRRKEDGGDCWKIVQHYVRCKCSGAEYPEREWEELASAPCPEGVSGGRVGTERRLDNYEYCPGETQSELADPEYYKRMCCEYPASTALLPYCQTGRALYRGGAEIEGGAEQWRRIYGDDVVLTPVSPPDGICGEEITTWRVRRENCCDDIVPLAPHPNNPEHFYAGETHYAGAVVDSGRPGELTWTLHGGLQFLDGTTRAVTGARLMLITTGESVCPRPWIRIDDGCEPITVYFEGGGASEPTLEEETLYVAPESQFDLSASGGVPPYMWLVGGGLQLVGYSQDGTVAYLRAGKKEEWCIETVRVRDQCGQEAKCDVYNSAGGWELVPAGTYDVCNPPGAPYKSASAASLHDTVPKDGYYARVGHCRECSWAMINPSCSVVTLSGCACPPDNLVSDTAYIDWYDASPSNVRRSPTCWYIPYNEYGFGIVCRYSQYTHELYKWICPT